MPSRRWFLKSCAAIGGLLSGSPWFRNRKSAFDQTKMPNKTHVVVIGAGAFGGWTGLYLLRRGARVTLLDAWGPGNSRASSGGETRVIRGTYGPNQSYTKMAARALQLWQEHEKRWQCRFLHRVGVLWMAAGDDAFERGSLPELRAAGVRYEELRPPELRRRWPQINFEGVQWGIYEPESGYLTARVACQAVVEGFVAEGGEYREAAVSADGIERGNGLALSDGSKVVAEQYVFACGPWLGKLFPQVMEDKIRATKQDVFFFGTPPGDFRFDDTNLPVWADHREHFLYGVPGNLGRGFKIADDTRGPEFDPTSGERVVSSEGLRRVRDYLSFRFPAMKDAPLLETRVCQYENSPDEGFIIDRHPAAEHVWLVGGGSGHGFKHGPALGEMVAGLVMEHADPQPGFRLGRFERRNGGTRGGS